MRGMMGRALLIVGWMATLGYIATAVVGYWLPRIDGPLLHALLALTSMMLLLFSHCWIMFYLIGTGRAIKEAVREGGLEGALYDRTKRFKARSSPAIMLALVLAMATFIVGGGVFTGAVPGWVHHVLVWPTFVVQVWALYVEQRVLGQNDRLMIEVDRRLATPARG